MNSSFFKSTKERSFALNLFFCVLSLFGILLVPFTIRFIFGSAIKNDMLYTFLSNAVLITMLILIYYKDLVTEFKTFKNNFKNNISVGFKYYGIGILFMVVFNAIIVVLLGKISANESEVRELLYATPVISLISICLIAPISEELIFRKSIRPIINNRIIYSLVCGILFGFAHILTNIVGGTFVLMDLIYILPYASLGCALALMDYDTNTTFTSIFIHAVHNTMAAVLLLLLYSGGIK